MMKIEVKTLDGQNSGSITVSDEVFGLEPRKDILHRVVHWQLAKRRSGSHKVKGRSEIRASGRKIARQKGTGRARHSTHKVGIFRGGGRAFGPKVQTHGYNLPKKVRVLGLKHAISSKVKSSNLVVIDEAVSKEGKTGKLSKQLTGLNLKNVLIVDGAEVNEKFQTAVRNIPDVDFLKVQGLNVYDILRRESLVITKAAIGVLEERFK